MLAVVTNNHKRLGATALLILLFWLPACTNQAEPTPTTAVVADPKPRTPITTPLTEPAAIVITPLPPLATLPPTDTPLVGDLSLSAADVILYPVPEIYEGEMVTFQILADIPSFINPQDVTVHILVDYQDIVSGTLDATNLQGSSIGLFEWVWDTTDEVGDHLVHVLLDRYDKIQDGDANRDNNQLEMNVTVNDPATLSPLERDAAWITRETECCLVHVVSGTAAARDLDELVVTIETAVNQAADKLDESPAHRLDVYLIDRVLGQGGYAGYGMVISYLDRTYASNGFEQVTIHEAVHLIDRQFAPNRLTFLAEGVAVWASGGHYKAENLPQRAKALVELNRYIPLPDLIDNFYPIQHEIGYLEAAGFVDYLVDNYGGWPNFRNFYEDVNIDEGRSPAGAIDASLQKHFHISLAEAEEEWLAYLEALPTDLEERQDLETTLRYFNLMRRYQQHYDPTAYFLTAWLPYPETLKLEGNPADLSRHPAAEKNIALEVMFNAADGALRAGDYAQANFLLNSIQRVLDSGGSFADPVAQNYFQVVTAAQAAGYEAHQVSIDGERAAVLATTRNSYYLKELNIVLTGQDWILLN